MEEVGAIPSVKVVLIGPSGVGKTTFLYSLMEENIPSEISPTQKTYVKETIRQYFKFSGGRYVPAEQYKLILADTPGAQDKIDERRKGIEKSIVGIFFYDLTNPRTVRELEGIITNEIINTEAYYNLMGIVIVGCKKDEGINSEALNLGLQLAQKFTELVMDLWGYKIPHLAINCKNKEEVHKAFYIAESLVMDKPPEPIVESLSAEKALVTPKVETKVQLQRPPSEIPVRNRARGEVQIEVPEKPRTIVTEEQPQVTPSERSVPSKPIPPHLRGVSETVTRPISVPKETPETQETRVELSSSSKALEMTFRVRLHESEKIWETVAKLHQSRIGEIEEIYFIKKAGEVLFLAYSPRDKNIRDLNINALAEALQFERIADSLARDNNIDLPKYYIISSSSKSLLIVKRKNALLILKTKGKPSDDLINLLV